MSRSYYLISDISLSWGDKLSQSYFYVNDATDILGHIISFIKTHEKNYEFEHKLKDLRLYRFSSKKQYEISARNWLDSIDYVSKFDEKYLNCLLEDDETETGGTSSVDETLRDFVEECGINLHTATIHDINRILKQCGIKPINFELFKR